MKQLSVFQMEEVEGGKLDCDMVAAGLGSFGVATLFVPGFQLVAGIGIGLSLILSATNCK